MSLSKGVHNWTLGVNKKTLLEVLWEKGVRPRDKDFEVVAKHQLYLLLGLREATCSITTNKDIASEAEKFCVSVRGYWSPKKCGTNKNRLFAKPYFERDIIIEVIPPSQEIPELAPSNSGNQGRQPGPFKPFEEKGTRAKFAAAAAVRDNHPPGAVLQAAPKAASQLGKAQTATAIRKILKDTDVNAGLALDGTKNESKLVLKNTFIGWYKALDRPWYFTLVLNSTISFNFSVYSSKISSLSCMKYIYKIRQEFAILFEYVYPCSFSFHALHAQNEKQITDVSF